MKKVYLLITSSALIALFFVDGWWILRWIVCSVISTGTVGAGFNALVDVCANNPKLWESVSKKLLALPPKELPAGMTCPLGTVVFRQVTKQSLLKIRFK